MVVVYAARRSAADTRLRSRATAAGLQLEPRRGAMPAAVTAGHALGDGALPAVGNKRVVDIGGGVEDRRDAQRAALVGE
jgi:hypothetical protein